MILRVGLTGGLASGKSTVARRLAAQGIPTLDADRIVRDLYRPGASGSRAIAAEFGPDYLLADGAVDRERLARTVFEDPTALARLNRLVHPLVLEEEAAWFRGLEERGEALGVVEATLLVETGGRSRYDVVVVLSAPEEERLERAVRRAPGTDRGELGKRIRAQLPDEVREREADLVLRSDGEKEELLGRVDALAARLRERAARGPAGRG